MAKCTARELVERSGLSQSALSQHLAKLRDEGLVEARREAQSIFYRIADPTRSAPAVWWASHWGFSAAAARYVPCPCCSSSLD